MDIKKLMIIPFLIAGTAVFAQSEEYYNAEAEQPAPKTGFWWTGAVKLGGQIETGRLTNVDTDKYFATAKLWSDDADMPMRFEFGGVFDQDLYGVKFILGTKKGFADKILGKKADPNDQNEPDPDFFDAIRQIDLFNAYVWAKPFNKMLELYAGRIDDALFASHEDFTDTSYDNIQGARIVVAPLEGLKIGYAIPYDPTGDAGAFDVLNFGASYEKTGLFTANLAVLVNTEPAANTTSFAGGFRNKDGAFGDLLSRIDGGSPPDKSYYSVTVPEDDSWFDWAYSGSANILATFTMAEGVLPVGLSLDAGISNIGAGDVVFANEGTDHESTVNLTHISIGLKGEYKLNDALTVGAKLGVLFGGKVTAYSPTGTKNEYEEPFIIRVKPYGSYEFDHMTTLGVELGVLVNETVNESVVYGYEWSNDTKVIIKPNIGIYLKPQATFKFGENITVKLWDKFGFDTKGYGYLNTEKDPDSKDYWEAYNDKGGIRNIVQLDFIYSF